MNHLIDKFLNQYPGKSTRQTYNSALNWFFQSVKVDADSYFNLQRDYTSDVNNFKLFLNGRPPKTVHTYLMAVKQFLLENNVDLGVRFWKNLRNRSKMKKVKAVTKDVTVSKEQIRQMLSHATVRDRAIVLTLISSGMRIGECLLIKLRDIDFTKDPVQIDIQGINTKNGERRTVFISYEAKAALEEWLKVREQWLYSSITRLNGIGRNKSLKDDRLFPYNRLTIVMSWERMLKAANLFEQDKVTNRTLIHPHTLRKYFSTNLPDGMRKDMVERLLGHSGYLDGVYDNFTDEDMGVQYKKAMSVVSVYEDQDTIQLKDNLAAKDEQIANLKTQVAALNIASKTSEEQIQSRVNLAVDIAVKQAMETLLVKFSNQHDNKNEKPINELANIIFEG